MMPVVTWSAPTPMLISSTPTSGLEAQKRRYIEASSPAGRRRTIKLITRCNVIITMRYQYDEHIRCPVCSHRIRQCNQRFTISYSDIFAITETCWKGVYQKLVHICQCRYGCSLPNLDGESSLDFPVLTSTTSLIQVRGLLLWIIMTHVYLF